MRFMVFEKLRYLIEDPARHLAHHQVNGRAFGIEVTLNDTTLMRSIDDATYRQLARDLKDYELSVHLPFYGLNLGCFDRWIGDYSERTLREGLQLCEILGAQKAVTHTTVPALLSDDSRSKWLNRFLARKETIEMHARAHGVALCWENTYETDLALFDAMVAQNHETQFCLDVGHIACFAKYPIVRIIDHLGHRITHLHLHDNDGADDHHWPLGKGTIDFTTVVANLPAMKVDTAVFELEPNDFRESIPQIERVFSSLL